MSREIRFSRQVILPELGPEGQAELSKSKVVCVGAGGLGAPVLYYLAAAGVGEITIVDGDRVGLSNLQRQILFNESDLGSPKAEAAARRLSLMDKSLKVTAKNEFVTGSNVESLLEGADLVIDATDQFTAKFLLNDCAYKLGIPLIYGSILGFEGQLGFFAPSHSTPCYRCLYKDIPKSAVPTCETAGVLGAFAGWVGTAQALLAIRYLSKRSELKPNPSALTLFDGISLGTKSLTLGKNPACSTCSKERSEIRFESEPNAAMESNGRILLDVREQSEFHAGTLKGALSFPLSLLKNGQSPETLLGLSKDTPITVFCQSGMRSKTAIRMLETLGYKDLRDLAGGLSGLPG